MKKLSIRFCAGVCTALLVTGCAALSPVPSTKMQFQIAGTQLEWRCPKQFAATNIVAEVGTNGLARISVGAVSSLNDPAVVDKAYAGQAAVAKEYFTGVTGLVDKLSAAKP